MNLQNRSSSGKLSTELASCRKSIRNTCVLVKHVGKTKPTAMQFTGKIKQSDLGQVHRNQSLPKKAKGVLCTCSFIVLTSGIPHDLKIPMH